MSGIKLITVLKIPRRDNDWMTALASPAAGAVDSISIITIIQYNTVKILQK